MKTVGLITYSQSLELSPSDQLLVEPLRKAGFHAKGIPWDDPHVDWKIFDLLILRSPWNYYYHYEKFLTWLTRIETLNIPTWNPIPILRWNTNKRYLLDLEQKGVPIIPSIIIDKQSKQTLTDIRKKYHWTDVIIKPIIGESSYGIDRISPNDQQAQQTIDELLTRTDVLAQQFIPEIYEGEFSLIFFNGVFSHAVMKRPKNTDFRTDRRFGGKFISLEARPKLIDQASRIIKTIKTPLLYARVDGIIKNGKFYLMELELTDPQLFFDLNPEATVHFAQSLKKLAKRT